MTTYHLAQINIAHAKEAMESDTMKGFVNRLDEINQLAERSPGFVWRLQTEAGNATSIQVFDNPLLIVNMSVWEDLQSLKNFVYKTLHVDLIRDREAWFSKMIQSHQALWWIPVGHVPTVEEGKERLESLQQHGPNENAFTFSKPFVNLSGEEIV